MKPGPTPCAGQWQLFDSTERADHERALGLCVTCPLLAECSQHAADTRATLGSYAALTGTWAGRLYGATDKGGRRRKADPPHGTHGARRLHYERGEAVCEECRVAFNIWQAEYAQRRKGAA